MVDAMNMLNLLLPGTAFTYMGEEIGLKDAQIIDLNGQNSSAVTGNDYYRVLNKDLGSTPEQWNVSKSSGLTFYSNTWLPVKPNYWKSNLDAQKKLNLSHYGVYQRLAALRKTQIFQNGDFEGYELSEWVYVFSRYDLRLSTLNLDFLFITQSNPKYYYTSVLQVIERGNLLGGDECWCFL